MHVLSINLNIIRNGNGVISIKKRIIRNILKKNNIPESDVTIHSFAYSVNTIENPKTIHKSYYAYDGVQQRFFNATVRRYLSDPDDSLIIIISNLGDICESRSVAVNIATYWSNQPRVKGFYITSVSMLPLDIKYRKKLYETYHSERDTEGGHQYSRAPVFPEVFKESLRDLKQAGVSMTKTARALGMKESTLYSIVYAGIKDESETSNSGRHGRKPDETELAQLRYALCEGEHYDELATIYDDGINDLK